MKRIAILLLFLFFLSCNGRTQDIESACWLPLKRVEEVYHLKVDKCDSLREYPFKKIKFISNQSVSLFGFGASDPDVCKLIQLNDSRNWSVETSTFNTLAHYPSIYRNSTVLLNIDKGILYVRLANKGDTIIQKFVNEYAGVKFTDYRETDVGNLFIYGKFEDDKGDIIKFSENGKIDYYSKENKNKQIFTSYNFRSYTMECEEYMPRRIIELTSVNTKKNLYLVKNINNRLDFYTIKSMKNNWTVDEMEFSFSLTRIE